MKKYTLITGACGGLGKSFVKFCAKNGENLVLTGTSETKLKSLVNDFSEEFKDIDVKTAVLDLSKPEDRKNIIKFLNDNKIEVNRLINNAGVIIEGDTMRFSEDEILNAVEVNCKGTLDLTMKCLNNILKCSIQKILILNISQRTHPKMKTNKLKSKKNVNPSFK